MISPCLALSYSFYNLLLPPAHPQPLRKTQTGRGRGHSPLPAMPHLLGGDVDLFQFAVRFSSFQSFLLEGKIQRDPGETKQTKRQRGKQVVSGPPPSTNPYLLNIPICGFPHVVKLDYACK